jgi:hypothetical protein
VGCLVVLADVRLDLHDPRDPAAGGVVPNEAGAQQAAPGLERRAGEQSAEVDQLETAM